MKAKYPAIFLALFVCCCFCSVQAKADSSSCPLTGINYAAIAPVVADNVPNQPAITMLLAPELDSRIAALGIKMTAFNDPLCHHGVFVSVRSFPVKSPGTTNYEAVSIHLLVPESGITTPRLTKTVTASIWDEDILDVCRVDSAGTQIKADMDKLLDDFAADYAKDNPVQPTTAVSNTRILTGLAAIYFAAQHTATIDSLPQVYHSSNGGFYYRKPDDHTPVWLIAPTNGIIVTVTDLKTYASDWAQYQGQAEPTLPDGAVTQLITAFDTSLTPAS